EGLGAVAPAVLDDGVPDLVAGLSPPIDSIPHAQQIGHCDSTVQGHPAHELRIEEVTRFAAELPDPVIFLLPAARGSLGNLGEELARRFTDAAEVVPEPVGGPHELAVDVDLALVPGPVADTHGAALAPAGQVGKLALGQVLLTPDAEHDLQIAASLHPRRA